jgi:hypothetical protein
MCLTTLFEAANVIFYNVVQGRLLKLVRLCVKNLVQIISAITILLTTKQLNMIIFIK